MPKTAQLTDKIAVLRSVVTNDNAHSSSGYQMLTGIEHSPLNRESALPGPPNDHPSLAAVIRALREDKGLPSSVVIPEHIWNDGNKPWPGQDAGFIGRAHDPWLIKCYPNENRFDVPGMTLAEELTQLRVNNRQSLLSQINQTQNTLAESEAVQTFNIHSQKAYSLLGLATPVRLLIYHKSSIKLASDMEKDGLLKVAYWHAGWLKRKCRWFKSTGHA